MRLFLLIYAFCILFRAKVAMSADSVVFEIGVLRWLDRHALGAKSLIVDIATW